MSRVLVTGGLGFLGGHLVSSLAERGHDVRILARGAPVSAAGDPGNVIRGDVRDRSVVERAVRGMKVVIHTVSNFRKGGSDKSEARAINVQGSLNVCEAAAAAGVEQFIHCSTIGVHGSVKEVPASEETPFNPGDLYQSTKLEAEQQVRAFAERSGLPTTVIRPISIFGPGDRRMLKLFRMIQKGRFVLIGDGSALFQPAYIDDVVQGFLISIGNQAAIGEVFIIGGEEYVPLTELVRVIADELGVAPPRWRIPLAPVLLAADLCERICVPLGLEPPLHRRRVSFFQNNRAFTVEKAKRVLGYRPGISLNEGIRLTIRWYREHGWL